MSENAQSLPGVYMPVQRVRIYRSDLLRKENEKGYDPSQSRVFITLNAAETNVTILDDDGTIQESWMALFGWSVLIRIPIMVSGRNIFLEEKDVIASALQGEVKLYGKPVDTSEFRQTAIDQFKIALDDILSKTVGSGVQYPFIELTGPEWLRSVMLEASRHIPNIIGESIEDD